MRIRPSVIVTVAAIVGLLPSSASGGTPQATAGEALRFVDRADELGLRFHHDNGMRGRYHLPEITGGGGALLDYDRDGDPDAYLVQGGVLDGPTETTTAADEGAGDRLYRSHGGNSPRFSDSTTEAHVDETAYGMGVASADYDNDGWPDLYVTNFGPNRLLRNNGDGTFTDVTDSAAAAAGDDGFSTSATFFDLDRDGWLDLFVVNYVEFDLRDPPRCYALTSRRDYCGPAGLEGQADRLLRADGAGGFEDVSGLALLGDRRGPGLGVLASDLDGDGWLDLYVANDGAANRLWINQRDGTFVDDALLAGAALNRYGLPEAGMGVDAGDFDADGDDDLFVTHLRGETNTLYVNEGGGLFTDRTLEFALASPSVPYTSFGTLWIDYDSDAWLDLVVLNGEVRIIEEQAERGSSYPLGQPDQLFRNEQGLRFADASPGAGATFGVADVSRAVATADFDSDGDPDLLVVNNNGPARLLFNRGGDAGRWIGLTLVGRSAPRDGVGSRIELRRPDGLPPLWRRARTDGSYCAASDARLTLGLGALDRLDEVVVHWADGAVESFGSPDVDHYHVLRQGSGRAIRGSGGGAERNAS